jgi:hypothetical protein
MRVELGDNHLVDDQLDFCVWLNQVFVIQP